MRKWNMRYLILAIVTALFVGAAVPVEAAGDAHRLSDDAGLLTDTQRREVEEMAEELEFATSWDIFAITTSDAQGMDAAGYGEAWFETYHTGDDGVVCLIDMDNREIRICTFGEAIYYLTDDRVDAVLDDAYDKVSQEDYCGIFESMISGIFSAWQRGIPGDQYTYDEDTNEVVGYYRDRKRITIGELLIAIVAAAAACGGTVGIIVGKYRLKWGGYQYSYRENSKVTLNVKRDTFVNQMVTHRRIPKNTGSSGGSHSGGSRSTTHHTSSGRRSGGGGRKF